MTVVNDHLAHHRHVQALYEELLKDVNGVEVHRAPSADYDSNYWLCTITIDPELKVVMVRGAVPGHKDCTLIIKSAVKKEF